MREVNFSIPNVNKASVGITTALYDRRALDCTSTLPLINSLNHLAYLTTSSARIRDILTVDGGVERLVCILKQGRKDDMMEMWKWNLAFQCIVNIGVRGSEGVRRRVVEADMVPVIATVLNNYIAVTNRWREEKDAESKRSTIRFSASKPLGHQPREGPTRTSFHDRHGNASDYRSLRRHPPPPALEIPQPLPHQPAQQHANEEAMEVTPGPPNQQLASPQDHSNGQRSQYQRHPHHHHNRSQDSRMLSTRQSIVTGVAIPSVDVTDGFGLRPVRDVDRLPSTIPALQNGITSQPESPTTPGAPVSRPNASPRGRRRPSLRQQQSQSGDSDDGANDVTSEHSTTSVAAQDEPMVDIQATLEFEGTESGNGMLDGVAASMELNTANGSDGSEVETFNIAHRTALDGSILAAEMQAQDTNAEATLRPPAPPLHVVANPSPALQNNQGRLLLEQSAPPSTPRDEDVLLSLQLLAYVSKYCNLRSYFQRSHLVPKLKLARLPSSLDSPLPLLEAPPTDELDEEEYLLPDDFNIFPLVEKFTVRHHHSQDMQNWAGVVMRNLCRKDDSRGGIRQCAYFECGKWEEKTRQFAKCRRCRRTKYCSKECQKNAWVYHRHWCQVANP